MLYLKSSAFPLRGNSSWNLIMIMVSMAIMMILMKVTHDDDEDDDLGGFQGSRDNWMTGEAEIPATLAFLDIGADISQFHYKIFP